MNIKHLWHQKDTQEVLSLHQTELSGLSDLEVQKRISSHGENRLENAKRKTILNILVHQFSDFLILLLLVASLIAGLLGEVHDMYVILAIVTLNGLLGFTQEFKAEKAMEALAQLSTPRAKVKRNNQIIEIPTYELVPGDITILEAGAMVPADLRIIEGHNLQIDESALTGESVAVDKITSVINLPQQNLGDLKNMAFKGTLITKGRGIGVVVNTGMQTQLGLIAKLLKEEVSVKTPLQERLTRFAKKMALVVVAVCILILIIGLLQGGDPVTIFMTSLSLAVAGIPEALPAVLTVSLALGARRMSKKNALIRKLAAVEALGSVTTICTDKTGTLTENKMKVSEFFSQGKFSNALNSQDKNHQIILKLLSQSHDAHQNEKGELVGDPTETALLESALLHGYSRKDQDLIWPRILELPFSSERQMMSTVHKTEEGLRVFTKGAPEKVLMLCSLSHLETQEIQEQIKSLTAKGERVLALATKVHSSHQIEIHQIEEKLEFLGLVGLIDPPRKEVFAAIKECQSAGVRIIMITGDHPETAHAIAKTLGISTSQATPVLTGHELSSLNDEKLKKALEKTSVFARVAPEHKLKLIKALQESGQIVAMTGDGVNDAPALNRAEIGVAMGKGGTDVAREASAMILLDDNFATIVGAIKEGRRIYDNLRKFIRFALSGNSGEILTLFLAPFIGLPIPLLPIHILWVNLVTDGLPGIALALERPEKNIMQRSPRYPNESIFAQGLGLHTIWVGCLTAFTTLGVAWYAYQHQMHWQTMSFTVLTFIQMGHVMAIRSDYESLWNLGLFSNLPLIGSVILTFVLQLILIYSPVFQGFFKTQALTINELMISLGASSIVFCAVEIEKFLKRRKTANS